MMGNPNASDEVVAGVHSLICTGSRSRRERPCSPRAWTNWRRRPKLGAPHLVEVNPDHGRGGFLHSRVQEGDLLEFSGPSGAFTFTGRECKCILLIGGGVGITPLVSVLRYLTHWSWSGDIFLIYGCRAPQDIIFREELDYLQRRHSIRSGISLGSKFPAPKEHTVSAISHNM